jgi:hypothetical protein
MLLEHCLYEEIDAVAHNSQRHAIGHTAPIKGEDSFVDREVSGECDYVSMIRPDECYLSGQAFSAADLSGSPTLFPLFEFR